MCPKEKVPKRGKTLDASAEQAETPSFGCAKRLMLTKLNSAARASPPAPVAEINGVPADRGTVDLLPARQWCNESFGSEACRRHHISQ
jgi:hypothetical protein